MAVVLIGLVLIVNKLLSIYAETADISNTAILYYQENGVDKNVQSNTVITTVTYSRVTVSLTLQGRTNHSVTNVWFGVYPVGGGNAVFEKNDVTIDASGQSTFSVSNLTVGQNYDFKLRVNHNLSSLQSNKTFNDGLALSFGQQIAGDFNGDNTINSADFAQLSNVWNRSDATCDITGDAIINTLDFSILCSNWFKQGQ